MSDTVESTGAVHLNWGRSPSNAVAKIGLSIAPPSARSRSSRSIQSGFGLGLAVGMKRGGVLTLGRSRARRCHGAGAGAYTPLGSRGWRW
jgi:hypothetical protein